MTDKLKGIEPGQRVRITFEAKFTHFDSEGDPWFEAENGDGFFLRVAAIDHPSFQIEPIEEPIKVGDRVTWRFMDGGVALDVIGLHGDSAWLALGGDPFAMPKISDLERVK